MERNSTCTPGTNTGLLPLAADTYQPIRHLQKRVFFPVIQSKGLSESQIALSRSIKPPFYFAQGSSHNGVAMHWIHNALIRQSFGRQGPCTCVRRTMGKIIFLLPASEYSSNI